MMLTPRARTTALTATTFLLCGVMAGAANAADEPKKNMGHRIIVADYSTHIVAIVDEHNKIVWQHPIRNIHDAHVLPNGNILFQTDWPTLVEMTAAGKIVWQYNAAEMNGNQGKHVEVHAFQRLPNGQTMIAESGPARIIEVDAQGKIQHAIPLHVDHPSPHRDTRLVRKLANGHYLVCQEGDEMVREYDMAGKVVWKYDAKARIYSAERLDNGNTLIGCGDGNRVIEINPAGKTVWAIEKNDLPGITLAWITMVQRLPNGNTAFVNCHAGPENPQMIEVTPTKQVVWTFHDFQRFGNSLPVGRILDVAKK